MQKIAAHISNLVQAFVDHQNQQQQNGNAGESAGGGWADILLTFMAAGQADAHLIDRRQSASSSTNSMDSGDTPMTAMAEADAEEDDDEDEELEMD